MPKDRKTDTKWKKDLEDLARRRPNNLRGMAPPTGSKFYDAYTKIIKCPAWLRLTTTTKRPSQQQTLFGKSINECNCGYEEFHGTQRDVWSMIRSARPYERPESPAPAPIAAAKPPPPEIPFGIPEVPTTRTSKEDVRNVDKTYNNKGQFPLLMFGYTCGKCPHCEIGRAHV